MNENRYVTGKFCPAWTRALLICAIIGALILPASFPAPVSAAGCPDIDGKAYALYDVQSGTFLAGENQDTPLSPASITKVMTVLLALENLELTDTIAITKEMYKSIPNDYVRLGLVEGEVITVEQALYACLLILANDAAMALALKIGGTELDFARLMNERAVEIGCTSTNFTNPYGLADKENLTSAHDMALILTEALKHDTYTAISTTRHYLMAATNKSGTRGMTNGNRFVATEKYAYENYIGGKTGFTNLSGHTIAAGASKDGRTLVGVILGAPYSEIRYANLISLFTYGFSSFTTNPVDPAEFDAIKDQAIAELKAKIAATGYDLTIADAKLDLAAYTTVPSARAAGGYACGIDMGGAAVQDSPADQKLVLPLYRKYTDGEKISIGTLAVTISRLPVVETTAENAASPKSSWLKTLLRVALVILFAAVFFFCLLVIYARIRNYRRRRLRRLKQAARNRPLNSDTNRKQ